LGGVTSEAAKLGETLNQTVAAAGKPFLGWLADVLSMANKVSGAVTGIVQSPVIQGLGKVTAGLSFAGSAAWNVVSIGSTLALGTRAFGAARAGAQSFAGGRDLARSGGTLADDAGRLAMMGYAFGGRVPTPLGGADRLTARAALANAWRGGANLTGGVAGYFADDMRTADWRWTGRDPAMRGLPATSEFKQGLTAARQTFMASDRGAADFGNAVKQSGQALGTYTRTVLSADHATMQMTRSLGRVVYESGAIIGRTAARGAAALPISPWLLGAVGAIGGVSWMRNRAAEQEDMRAGGVRGLNDGWGQFNEFAAAAGLASKGALSLGDALQETSERISAQNKSMKQALEVTSAEAGYATSGDYQRAFTANSEDPATIASEIRMMLGYRPAADAVARVLSDVTNQYGSATSGQVSTLVAPMLEDQDVYGTAVASMEATYAPGYKQAFGITRTGDTEAITTSIGEEITRQENLVTDVYGEEAATGARLVESQKAYTAALDAGMLEQEDIATTLAEALKVPETFVFENLARGTSFEDMLAAAGSAQTQQWWDFRREPNEVGVGAGDVESIRALGSEYQALLDAGFDVNNPDYGAVGGGPGVIEKESMQLGNAFADVTRGSNNLANALFGAEQAAREFATGKFALTGEQKDTMTAQQQSMLAYEEDPSAETRAAAASDVTRLAQRRFGGNTQLAQLWLSQQTGLLPESDLRRDVLNLSSTQVAAAGVVRTQGLGMMARTGETIAAAEKAAEIGTLDDPTAEAARQQTIMAGQQAYAERLGFMQQFVQASKDLDIQLARQQEDYQISVARAEEDFQRSMQYSEDDYLRSRERAQEDFYLSMARSAEDFRISQMRAERDFGISMTRMAEDAAASIYDPYERIAAQQVWDANALIANLEEQNEAIREQRQNLNKLKKMGLDQDTIDALGLADPQNAQQVARLLADADRKTMAQLNAEIDRRRKASDSLVMSKDNKDYRRAMEDFRKAMADSQEDFRRMRERANEDFHRQLARAEEDFEIQMERAAEQHRIMLDRMGDDLHRARIRAQEDLARMGQEVTGSYENIAERFLNKMAKLPDKVQPSLSRNILEMVKTAMNDAGVYLDTVFSTTGSGGGSTGGSGSKQSGTYSGASLSVSHSGSTTTAPHLTAASAADRRKLERKDIDDDLARRNKFLAAAYRQLGEPYNQVGDAGPDAFDCSGLVMFSARKAGVNLPHSADAQMNMSRRITSTQAIAGDVVGFDWGGDGRFDHIGIYVGQGKMIHANQPGGTVHVASVAEQGGNPVFGRLTPFAKGGVATKRTFAEIAEVGVPEAVIPLDGRGVSMIADAMVRYADQMKVKSARVQPYAQSTSVQHFSYDQRVQIVGPTTVMANDPTEYARKAELKARRDRLIQPNGR
jgi:cell wall-associated NlpC family hydrolase